MFEKADLACDLILNQIRASEKGAASLEIFHWMSRAGLDMMAEAGTFRCLSPANSESDMGSPAFNRFH